MTRGELLKNHKRQLMQLVIELNDSDDHSIATSAQALLEATDGLLLELYDMGIDKVELKPAC